MRLPRLSSFRHLLSVIRDRHFNSADKRQYQTYFSARNTNRRADLHAKHTVTIQCVEDIAYFGMVGSIITRLRQNGPVCVDLLILRSLRKGSSLSPGNFFWNSIGTNSLSDHAWKRVYFSFCNCVAYRSAQTMAPWTELHILWRAILIWRRTKNVDDLVDLTIRGIKIGDLIADSYLRFKPSHIVKLRDLYLVAIIRQSLKDLAKAFQYFSKAKPDVYLTSYTTYIQHGIAARVATVCGTRVVSFGNFQEFGKRVTERDPYQTKNSAGYATDFLLLPEQREKIAMADEQLSARTMGKIDFATAYMRNSAYRDEKTNLPEMKGALVIFLHDFYDSVHLYPWILFHDFWSWTCFTIEMLKKYDVPFFIKPHPNQTNASDEAFQQLCQKYPDLRILPSSVNNRHLAEAGIAGAVSVFGTVISEMAYLGVPTISCGDNPHASFPFCRMARSRAEYESLLRDYRTPPASQPDMKKQACAFFYMHNMNIDEKDVDLRDRSIKLRTQIWYDPQRSPSDILADFEDFGRAESLKEFCDKILSR